jgi:hypothetical protein
VLDITRLLFLTAFSYTGYPRLPQNSQTPIRPFTLQDSRFTASNRILNDNNRIILTYDWAYRFCSGTKALAPRPYRRYSSAWWAEFPQAHMPEAVRQLTNPQKQIFNIVEIKIMPLLTTNTPI